MLLHWTTEHFRGATPKVWGNADKIQFFPHTKEWQEEAALRPLIKRFAQVASNLLTADCDGHLTWVLTGTQLPTPF